MKNYSFILTIPNGRRFHLFPSEFIDLVGLVDSLLTVRIMSGPEIKWVSFTKYEQTEILAEAGIY